MVRFIEQQDRSFLLTAMKLALDNGTWCRKVMTKE